MQTVFRGFCIAVKVFLSYLRLKLLLNFCMNRMPVQYNAMLVLALSFGSSKQVFRFEIISQDIRIFRSKTKENHLNGEQAMKMDSHRLQDKTKSTDTSSLNVFSYCGQIKRVYGVINDVFISLSRCIYSPSFLKP